MSVTHPTLRPGAVKPTVRRRVVTTISRFTSGHSATGLGRGPLAGPVLVLTATSTVIVLLWPDLPALYLTRVGARPAQYAASPLTGAFRVVLGALLLAGVGMLVAPRSRLRQPGDRASAIGASAGRGCPPPSARVARPLSDTGRRLGVYAVWPASETVRSHERRGAVPRRTANRGQRPLRRAHRLQRDGMIRGSGYRMSLDAHRRAAASLTAEQRLETSALTLLTGYVSLSVIAAGAAINAGVPIVETLRAFMVAVGLALPPAAQVLHHPELGRREPGGRTPCASH